MKQHQTKKQSIVIRCIADKQKGFGNLSRSIALAEGLREKNYQTLFLIDNEKQATDILSEKNFSFQIISKKQSSKNQAEYINKIMSSTNSSLLLLDMREYGEPLSKFLSKYNFKTILIDDAWCKNVYVDTLVNVTPIQQYHKYKKINEKSRIYVGAKYFIADKKFLRHKKIFSQHKMMKIIISMGGSDPDDLTSFVTKSLLTLPEIQVRVVLGPLYLHRNKLKNIIKSNHNFTIVDKPKNIWEEFSRSDLAISNAGNTLFELAIMGIPTVCMAAVKHQIPYAEIFAKKCFAKNVGYGKKITQKAILNTTLSILSDIRLRKKMSKAGPMIVDGKGLSRVIDVIEKTIFTE
jgi:UDP-2,4-diacetamido-2,4,6-trideoxy-beta-L-altropyranose hydrolase